MTDNQSNAVDTLNSLLKTTIDSINGYEDSAKNVDSQRLQQIFRERADERQDVVQNLREEVRRLGGEPAESGSLLGKAHQSWEGLKSAVTGQDEKAIINEVERGEDYLKDQYQDALNSGDLTGEARQVVERCFQSVRQGHDQISQLKHGMESNA